MLRCFFWLIALFFLVTPAHAQQVIQIPVCAGNLPSSINPSAPTITVNASGQVCIAGNFSASVTVPTPQVAIPQPLSTVITTVAGVVSGSYADGALVTLGSIADSAYTTVGTSGDVVALLKGIFANVITPVAVTGSFAVSSPLGVNIAATTPINVTVGGAVSPLAVSIASSPVNVTGSLSIASTGQNIVQLAGQTLASPTSFGSAPVGSVQGVNAFVTNTVNVTTPTPLQVTLPASPVSVGLPATPFSVVVANAPTVVPTGTLAVNVVNTPTVLNIAQSSPQNVTVANTVTTTPGTSPQNVTVGNSPTVVLSGSPVSVGIAGPTPLNVTLVTLPGSPIQITQGITPLGRFLSLPPPGAVVGHTVTSAYSIINTGTQIGTIGAHQLVRVTCGLNAGQGTTPQIAYLQIFDASSATTAITLGTTLAKDLVPVAVINTLNNFGLAGYTAEPPGGAFSSGMIVAFTAGPHTSGSVGVGLNCTFAYN